MSAGGECLRKIKGGGKQRKRKKEKKKAASCLQSEQSLLWTDNALSVSYNCSLTMCRPLGFSVCNIWPSYKDRYGNQRPWTTCSAHPLGQPLIIFAQILALQNLANVSRSNYIYLVLGQPITSLPSLSSLTYFHTLNVITEQWVLKPSVHFTICLGDAQCRWWEV